MTPREKLAEVVLERYALVHEIAALGAQRKPCSYATDNVAPCYGRLAQRLWFGGDATEREDAIDELCPACRETLPLAERLHGMRQQVKALKAKTARMAMKILVDEGAITKAARRGFEPVGEDD
jgi:hypothetical protein